MVVNASASQWRRVTSGVPQGSVLESLLFFIYINDLPANLDSDAYLYVDDTKLFEEITCEAERMKLLSCLLKAEEWSNEWFKCHASSVRNSAVYRMATGNTEVELEKTNCEKDIGVLIDLKLNFDSHILSVVKKANSRIWGGGVIQRSFKTMDKDIFPLLFKAILCWILDLI